MVRSISKAILTATSLFYAFAPASAQDPAIATTGLRPLTNAGCFSSSDPLQDQGSWTYQSPGYCQGLCVKLQKPVMATTGGSNCFCGDQLPLASSKSSDSSCNTPCFGYDKINCTYPVFYNANRPANRPIGGGQGYWSVELTGLDNAVSNIKPSAAATSSSVSSSISSSKPSPSDPSSPSPKPKAAPSPDTTQNAAPAVITRAPSTIVITAPGQTSAGSPIETTKASSGPNKAVIAAGVVVGVAVLGIIAGGLFFCLRHRRRAREDERNQNAENPFNNNNLPSSAASMSDSRLEPSVMMQRRHSDGSIMDNQDYSRRILQVGLKPSHVILCSLIADSDLGDKSGQ